MRGLYNEEGASVSHQCMLQQINTYRTIYSFYYETGI